jgi:hypothetical protein
VARPDGDAKDDGEDAVEDEEEPKGILSVAASKPGQKVNMF